MFVEKLICFRKGSTMKRKQVLMAILAAFFCLGGNLFAYSGGDGFSEATAYQIANKADLLELAADTGNYDKFFILTADIDLTGQTFTRAVISPDSDNTNMSFEGTTFTGTFDGQGHAIKKLNIDPSSIGNDYLGLFGYLGIGSAVSNLVLDMMTITSNADMSYFIGGVSAYNKGSIRNCSATISIYVGDNNIETGGLAGQNDGSITQCSASIYIFVGGGSGAIGGIVGENHGPVKQCFTSGTLESWYYTIRLGGVVGDNIGGILENCYSGAKVTCDYTNVNQAGGLIGRLSGGTILNCYSTGKITPGIGASNIGGLIGLRNSGTVTNCFWDTTASGRTGSAGGTGLTTTDMQKLLTYTAATWDFTNETTNGTEDIWRMCMDGVNYPHLNWESIRGDFVCPNGVNTEDLSLLVQRWLSASCTSDNNFCGGTDINADGKVGLADFAIFAAHWLEGI